MVQVVGILNVTPDSFYDGGEHNSVTTAINQTERMLSEGADVIDIGCESTRPGSDKVSLKEELIRLSAVLPAIRSLTDKPISIDTYKPEVMAYAIEQGVDMINDIFALRSPGALETIAQCNVKVCLMHIHGSIENMHEKPHYNDVAEDVCDFFSSRIEVCKQSGIDASRIILDPGFGFSKKSDENFKLLKELEMFQRFGLPIYIGVSRKRFIGSLLNSDGPHDRLIGSLVAASWACQQGVAYVRTHDVRQTREAINMTQAILNG